MDQKYFDEIKAREQAATPGPWTVGDGTHQSLFNGKNAVISQGGRYVVIDRAVYPDNPDFNKQVFSNMKFIAHARTDIPELIVEVERLTAKLQKSPYGDDKIDELEESCDNLRFQLANKDQQIATLKKALEKYQQTEQWLDDMNNPLEPLKVSAALNSEIMKLNYRKEHKPESISELDGTIISALLFVQQAQEQEGKNNG